MTIITTKIHTHSLPSFCFQQSQISPHQEERELSWRCRWTPVCCALQHHLLAHVATRVAFVGQSQAMYVALQLPPLPLTNKNWTTHTPSPKHRGKGERERERDEAKKGWEEETGAATLTTALHAEPTGCGEWSCPVRNFSTGIKTKRKKNAY